MSGIGRREFVTLFGSAAAAWPLAAHAQQDRMRRIAVLMNLAADDPESPIRLAALLQGCSNWVGRSAETSKSTIVGVPATPTSCANTRGNWWRSLLT